MDSASSFQAMEDPYRAAKRAKREAQKEAEAAYYAKQEWDETERLVKIISEALAQKARLKAGGECVKYARIAVQAIRDDGLIFARIHECCDPLQFDGESEAHDG